MDDPLLGADIGHYRLEGVLGSGLDTRVYLALSLRDRRHYAFKMLATADHDGRLLKQLVMVLENPHVVKIYDYGTHAGRAWLVRELVVGRSLDEVLAAGATLGRDEALDLIDQALDGLAAYHANGMAHGALRPSNILLTDDLSVRLCDPRVGTSTARPDDLAWQAPEVRAGGAYDHLSDQYSLGALMHRALTGRDLDPGQARWTAGEARFGALAATIDRMLAEDPAARFPSLAACRAALRPHRTAQALPAQPPAGQAAEPVAVRFAPIAAAPATASARGAGARQARPAALSQPRAQAATQRINEALDAAAASVADGDLDAATAHAERAHTIVSTLAFDMPPEVTGRIVEMRTRIATLRKEGKPKRSWLRWW